MTSSLNKKHRKKCKAMSDKQLSETISKLEPKVRVDSSLLECAKWEYRKRLSKKQRDEDVSEQQAEEVEEN